VNLGDVDRIREIYEFMFGGISRKVFLNGLVGIMLERRKTERDEPAPICWCYDAITELILEVLDGEAVINYTGKKISKKEAKKLRVDKKEVKAFMKAYSEDKQRDAKKNRDYPRRVAFSSKNIEENYPKLAEAFMKCNHDFFDSMFDETEAEKRRNAELSKKEKQSVSERGGNNNNRRDNNNRYDRNNNNRQNNRR
jgi:hypothetical protein